MKKAKIEKRPVRDAVILFARIPMESLGSAICEICNSIPSGMTGPILSGELFDLSPAKPKKAKRKAKAKSKGRPKSAPKA